MGFIDLLSKVLGINQIEEQVTEEKNSENNELDGSIIVEIAKIKQEMITIEIYYPEKAEEIKQKIQELENFIEDSIEIDTDAVNKINGKYQEIKSEFEKFGDLLDKTNKKLQEISNTMERASAKTRTIQRKLKNVEALPVTDEDEFYGKDLMDALPSSDDTFENENYTINSDEDKD